MANKSRGHEIKNRKYGKHEQGAPQPARFRHSKKLGQNFLRDGETIDRIIEGSGVGKHTAVLEIGPGAGALTERLAEVAGRVIAVEIDERLVGELKVRFAFDENVSVVHGDILKVDVSELLSEALREDGIEEAVVIGNLPYYITTPIIMKLVEGEVPARSLTVMMQKEVAERLIADPGTKKCGAITYAVHYRCRVAKICDVDKSCFYPVPKVDSEVIRMDFRDEKAVEAPDEELFFTCIKAGFAMRRKTILNALSAMNGYDKETISEALERAGIRPEKRAEEIDLAGFAELTRVLTEDKE